MSTFVSATAATGKPPIAVRDNAAVVAAALPTDLPGYVMAGDQPKEATLTLCPTIPKVLDGGEVQAAALWQGGGVSLRVAAVLDPENAPADRLLATLAPPACPDRAGDTTYLYDRQPYERDGWAGTLNTSLGTAASGARYYEAAYLLSKGDALVNVVAGRAVDATTTFDPTVDDAAARCVETVLGRFAI